jgi:tetratricopeptide (TPR) repeat protein
VFIRISWLLKEGEIILSKGKRGSSGKTQQAAREPSSEAKEKLKQRELAASIEKYEAAIKSGASGVDEWSKLGELYIASGEYDKAVKYLDKALMLKPDVKQESSILLNLASAYAKGGVFEKEMECYNILLKKSTADPSVWGKAARAYERFGKIQEAVLYYTRAININPNDANLFYDYSFFSEKLGQLDRAVTAARRALELKPESEKALERLSILYSRTKDYEKAMNTRLKLLEKKPGDVTRWEDLAQVTMAGEKYSDAVRILQKGILRLNSPSLWYMLGDVYTKQDKEGFALYCYTTAAGLGNEAARSKADALISKKVPPKEISLHETALGEL